MLSRNLQSTAEKHLASDGLLGAFQLEKLCLRSLGKASSLCFSVFYNPGISPLAVELSVLPLPAASSSIVLTL
jgi:hypothetical protein